MKLPPRAVVYQPAAMFLAFLSPSSSRPSRPQGAREELDHSALLRCVAGDRLAFHAFVVRYERAVFSLLSRMLGHGPHVEELAQETFLRAHQAFARFDVNGPAKVSTWLLTIATRLALDARKRRQLPVVPLDEGLPAQDGATPETERRRRELGRALAKAAESLSDDQRAAFLLAEMHGFSMQEIAEAVGAPEATVKTRLFRAREHMKSQLQEWVTP